MRITVDISYNDLNKVLQLMEEKHKGPALVKFIQASLKQQKRKEFSKQIMEGKLQIDLKIKNRSKDDRSIWD